MYDTILDAARIIARYQGCYNEKDFSDMRFCADSGVAGFSLMVGPT